MKLTLLAGGTGAAKLAAGLAQALPPGSLRVVTNTADDDEFWGLLVCPDTDSVLYRLAGIFNAVAGFGVREETFHALEMLGRLGEPTWFGLGDRDLGLQVLRDSLLRRGVRLTEAVAEIARRLGVVTQVLPMTDDRVRTRIVTEDGELSLQSWLVRDRCRPAPAAVRFDGLDSALASPRSSAAIDDADTVIIGPSNPLLSIDPILGVLGRRLPRDRVLAVSPIVAGRSLKGPTVEMMRSLGEDPTALGVARRYSSVASAYVLDVRDAKLANAVAGLGMQPLLLDTVMADRAGEVRLATELVAALQRSVAR